MQIELAIIIGCASAVVLAQIIATLQTRSLRKLVTSLEARLDRQADALSLLTETSESGFALVARELERAAAAPAKPRKVATRRIATAARKGRTVAQIAAAEGLSESEVHLRLHMAAQAEA